MGSSSAIVYRSRGRENSIPERENPFSIHKLLQSRSNKSFSSSSCSSDWSSFDSSSEDSSSPSPIASPQFSRIPFSWEQLPGIPKNSTPSRSSSTKIKDSSLIALPLPPSATSIPSKRLNLETIFAMEKKKSHESIKRDPFVAALKKCSKDQNHRAFGDRMGFIENYTSCKRSCSVSESIVFLPRSNRTSYNMSHLRSK